MRADERERNHQLMSLLGSKYRRGFRLMIGLSVIGSVLEALSIAAIVPVISVILNPDDLADNRIVQALTGPLGSPRGDALVIWTMAFLGISFLFKNAILALIAWVQTRFRESVELHVSNSLFVSYLRRPYEWIVTVPTAEMLRNLAESRAVVDYFLGPRIVLITEGTIALFLLSILVAVEPVGSLLVAAIVALGGLAFMTFSKRFIRKLGEQRTIGDSRRLQVAQEALLGIRELRLYKVTDLVAANYRGINEKRIQADQRYTFFSTLPVYWLEMILMVSLVALTVTLVAIGRESQTIVSFLALFSAAAFRVLPSANRVITSLQALKYGRVQLNSTITDLSYDLREAKRPLETIVEDVSPSIPDSDVLVSLRGVTFRYTNSGTNLFEDLNFDVLRGSRIGIVGPSGSGKTTLVSLLVGLLAPTEGTVIVAGKRIKSPSDIENLRIAYASQDPYIIDGSVAENIRFGRDADAVPESAIRLLLISLGLEGFALDDHLFEQGKSLSGGQKQRIGLARALASRPEILILDEPTSAVDDATEQLVIQALEESESQCTTILITHRESILEICTSVYVVENGQVKLRSVR